MNFEEGNPTLLEEAACVSDVEEAFSLSAGASLLRDKHAKFALDGLTQPLSCGHLSLDGSRPWLFYWCLHSLYVLGASSCLTRELKDRCVEELLALQCPATGGFKGHLQGRLPHLASTYAATAALVMLGAGSQIDRTRMQRYLLDCKQANGSFRVHEDGEDDLRATYCALAVARMLDIGAGELCEGVAEHIVQCQTYEGGLGAVPGAEAHGGYTYCGIASLKLLGKLDLLDTGAAAAFCSRMQCQKTGGFRGRTNKLVDGCYSFWQGASLAMLGHRADWSALVRFVLEACQASKTGGLRDKPSKPADAYHTCYCLSGLSIAEHSIPLPRSELANIDPVLNICI